MKRCRSLVSLVLCMAILAGFVPAPASAAQQETVLSYQDTVFPKLEIYTDGRFQDVKRGAWYEGAVKSVYERGLMKGTSNHTFNPNGTFTLAEAVTIAANLHSRYHGKSIPAAGGAWYQKMVNYCVNNRIITSGQFDDYTRPATRAEMAGILIAALPENQWTVKNNVTELPDVRDYTIYRDAIFKMYNAGILAGTDAYGTFNPHGQITRAEVAAITARCAVPEERVTVSLKPYVRPLGGRDLIEFLLTDLYAFAKLHGNMSTYTTSDNTLESIFRGAGEGDMYVSRTNELTGTDITSISVSLQPAYVLCGLSCGISLAEAEVVLREQDAVLKDVDKGHRNSFGYHYWVHTRKYALPNEIDLGVKLDEQGLIWSIFARISDQKLVELKQNAARQPLTVHEAAQKVEKWLNDRYGSDAPDGGYYVVFEDEQFNLVAGKTVSFFVRYAGNNAHSANVLVGSAVVDLQDWTGTITWDWDRSTEPFKLS